MSTLRKDLFKTASQRHIERYGVVTGGVLLGAAALLTAVTMPWLAPLWLAGALAGGAGLNLAGARRLLANDESVAALTDETIRRYHLPRQVSAELAPYVEQAATSAIEIVTRVEQLRGEPLYDTLSGVVDTVGLLLDRITQMSERVVETEALFASIEQQSKRLPGSRLPDDAAQRAFEHNLFRLQQSIDAARQQVVEAVASMGQISVQTLMLQAQDAALVDDTTGSARLLATNQAELLQARIAAMDEVASLTEAATSRLLPG